jgi:hypothetical protein
MRSFHDLLLPYDVSQIDRTARYALRSLLFIPAIVFKSGRWAEEAVDNAPVPP